MRTISPYSWGIQNLSIEKEAVANGMIKLGKAEGIMPDGFTFSLPEMSALPASRIFTDHFHATQEMLAVYLALPSEKPSGKNVKLNHESEAEDTIRFSHEEITIVDENSGLDQRSISTADPNFKILFEDEVLEDYSVLKVAELRRSSESEYILNEEFIPPCLSIQASGSLQSGIRRILELLVARSNKLRNNRRFTADGQLDISTKDLVSYGQLSAISTWLPRIHQYHETGKVHPYTVYRTLLSVAGSLTTFSGESEISPTSFPIYTHTDLSRTFFTIERQIRQVLGEFVVEKNYQLLPMEQQSDTMYQVTIDPDSLLENSNFYVIYSGEYSAKQLKQDFPESLRVASPKMISEVLSTAIRALPVSYSSSQPPGLPPRDNAHYIELKKRGPFWDGIKKSQMMTLYLPSEFDGMELEVIAVKEFS